MEARNSPRRQPPELPVFPAWLDNRVLAVAAWMVALIFLLGAMSRLSVTFGDWLERRDAVYAWRLFFARPAPVDGLAVNYYFLLVLIPGLQFSVFRRAAWAVIGRGLLFMPVAVSAWLLMPWLFYAFEAFFVKSNLILFGVVSLSFLVAVTLLWMAALFALKSLLPAGASLCARSFVGACVVMDAVAGLVLLQVLALGIWGP